MGAFPAWRSGTEEVKGGRRRSCRGRRRAGGSGGVKKATGLARTRGASATGEVVIGGEGLASGG